MDKKAAELVARQTRLLTQLQELSARVESRAKACGHPVEKKLEVVAKSVVRPNPVIPDGVKKVMKECVALKLSADLIEVAPEYYNWTLPERWYDLHYQARAHLNAPSVHHLCKSILLENTACAKTDCADPNNARFYMVLINYTSRLHSHKVFRFVRSLANLSRKRFHFRLADDALSARLSGYGHNAIPPLALAECVPLIVDQRLLSLSPPLFYAGGGHVDWKLCAQLAEFVKCTACFVADVTHEGESNDDAAGSAGSDDE